MKVLIFTFYQTEDLHDIQSIGAQYLEDALQNLCDLLNEKHGDLNWTTEDLVRSYDYCRVTDLKGNIVQYCHWDRNGYCKAVPKEDWNEPQ